MKLNLYWARLLLIIVIAMATRATAKATHTMCTILLAFSVILCQPSFPPLSEFSEEASVLPRFSRFMMFRKTLSIPCCREFQLDNHREFRPNLEAACLIWYCWGRLILRAVHNHVGGQIVFALDEALMCQGSFLGRNDEYIVWAYGDDSLSSFNGIVLLGNRISPYCVKERNSLMFTDFNRTLCDSLDNENILDIMITYNAKNKHRLSLRQKKYGS